MISNLLTEITDAGSQHLQKVLSIFIYKIKGGGSVGVFRPRETRVETPRALPATQSSSC